MSWRTVVIANRCKLDTAMGYLVIRGEETVRVFLDEISVLMVENTAVSLTVCLLEALTEKKIKVIFCDRKRNPHSELVPCTGSYDAPLKLRKQLSWSENCRQIVWTVIIARKITNQARLLRENGREKEAGMLERYLLELTLNDATNREGHAAKVYFNALFGREFTRREEDPVNAALNYGYSLILSAVNREVAAAGYLLQLGLHHDNVHNVFNLSCDLMEPFRAAADRKVLSLMPAEFGVSEKRQVTALLFEKVVIAGAEQTLLNAVKIYCRSVFEALNAEDPDQIRFAEL